jgi:tetratricopeptide (TPR) repeat protein
LIQLLRFAEAEDHLRTAVSASEGRLGPESASYSLDQLGRVLSERGRHAEALPLHERALALHEKVGGPDSPDIVESTLGIGRVYVGLHQAALAIPPLERCLKIVAPGQALEQAEARLLLAQALHDTRRSPARAKDLAAEARDVFRARGRGPLHERNLARAEMFLDERR